jgi:hypothetical protein
MSTYREGPRQDCTRVVPCVRAYPLGHLSPRRDLERRFPRPDGDFRPSRALDSSFFSGFGPKSIRRAHAIPGPPRCARGLRTKRKHAKRREFSPALSLRLRRRDGPGQSAAHASSSARNKGCRRSAHRGCVASTRHLIAESSPAYITRRDA